MVQYYKSELALLVICLLLTESGIYHLVNRNALVSNMTVAYFIEMAISFLGVCPTSDPNATFKPGVAYIWL